MITAVIVAAAVAVGVLIGTAADRLAVRIMH